MEGRLDAQVIAVTSADAGYGRSVAPVLAQSGASVVLIGGNADTLAQLASHIEYEGGTAIPIKADVGVPLDWVSAQGRILEIFGALHGVVHLADKRAHSTFAQLSEGEWMELFNCNVKSSVAVAQVLRRRLPSTWLTLIGPHLDEKGLHAAPQRGALRGLAEHAHVEDLRVNVLLPSRAAAGGEHDRPLAEAVMALARPELRHLRGIVADVPLPDAPSLRPSELSLL
ncbi:SDR family NAD(P)-dependent oxidoreductase [Deinococcus yavapaiensis]|uniref:Short subunit dehydrogenase n=1 Tax=Deinococcus yavapaiensis KR-236 TaxID=694435 RepID=A0A318SGA6_9DEIO|nr:SDR family NAD(P)-dependent oxidoreductase [Deinococcus yavapaiensis]PYE48705.1 short subunit dehydrogenase [Deinococcus yavapaiensis KR-236]